MSERITEVRAIPIRVPRDTPYLGQLEAGVNVSEKGYFVRPGNRSVYSIHDQSTLVRIECGSGAVGWGECVSFVVPEVAAQIIHDIIGPYLVGRDPQDPVVLYHDLYDLMRVRGYLAATTTMRSRPWTLRSGIWPRGSRGFRCASSWAGSGTRPFLPMSRGYLCPRSTSASSWPGPGRRKGSTPSNSHRPSRTKAPPWRCSGLREALGPSAVILCDMHWKHTAAEAIRLIQEMQRWNLAVAEAHAIRRISRGRPWSPAAVAVPVGLGGRTADRVRVFAPLRAP